MSIADTFLRRFRSATHDGDVLSLLADDAQGFGAALDKDRDQFSTLIGEATEGERGAPAHLNDDCFATAACDQDGVLVASSSRFTEWFGYFDLFNSAVRKIRGTGSQVSLFTDDIHGRPVALAAAKASVSRHWPLHDEVRAAVISGNASYAVAAFQPSGASLNAAARAYGLTAAEGELVRALAQHADLKKAAVDRNVTYETARKFLSSAMRKTGSKRQTELVRKVMLLAGGDIPCSENITKVLMDIFGLSQRQAELCVLLASGATRDDAAKYIGISSERAKADLKVAFQACGVGNAVDLSRIVTEVEALKGLAIACDVSIHITYADESLRLVPRKWAAGRIAFADHGPVTGLPVLLFHSNMSGRHHPPSFIKALQQSGYRPIAIERSGYGLTDYVAGDPIDSAINDLHEVMDALGLKTAKVIARCTTASLIAIAAIPLGRVSGGVMLWPDAPERDGRPRSRMSDYGRRIYAEFPEIGRSFARLLCTRINDQIIEKLWLRASDGLPCDLAVLADPAQLCHVVRGTRQAVSGFEGFLAEAMSLGGVPRPRPITSAAGWTILIGEGYERFDVADAMAFWQSALPDANVRQVFGGVHFMHITNEANVIAALAG